MHIEFVVKPCPWCKKTPGLWMPIEEETWSWFIRCDNPECSVEPRSKHVNFRNTAKTSVARFIAKVDELIGSWNKGNDLAPIEKKSVCIDKIARNFTDR